jgi:hypothetical protein
VFAGDGSQSVWLWQGGMSNEMYNVLARVTDGLYEGIAIGGDVYPGSTLSDHVLRFNNIPQVRVFVHKLCLINFRVIERISLSYCY